jgi:LysR family hydrogen peroxide-inducible transcriptional activator
VLKWRQKGIKLMTGKMHFSLTQLEYILAVHRFGHFGKAAEACHVTQPTLSMQIQKLEEDLGIVIFDRSKKPILLTEVGKKVVEQIRAILFEVRKIESIILEEQAHGAEGELTLAVIPTVAPYLLPRLLPVLESLHPSMELRIMEMQTDHIIEALNNDEIDVGLLATPLKIAKIFEHALYYEPFYVLCKKGQSYSDLKKVKYSALKMDQIWLLEEGHCLRNQVLDLCTAKKEKIKSRKYKFESGSLETLKKIVDSYGGYTLLPQLATDNLGENSHLVPFERPIPAREIGLIYRREHYKSELIESLAESIIKSLPEDLQKLRPKDLNILPISSES